MGDEVILMGVVEMTVRSEPLIELIKSYTNALRFVVSEILRDQVNTVEEIRKENKENQVGT